MTLPPMPTHLNLPPRSREEVLATSDRPTYACLVARYGKSASIPAGTIVWTECGRPMDQMVGNGWRQPITWLPEGQPTKVSRIKHPSKVGTLTHHLRFSLAATRQYEFSGFMSEIRNKVTGSFRGVAKYSRVSKSTVSRLCDPSQAFSVSTGKVLEVLRVYGLQVRLTDCPYREADVYLLTSGNWLVCSTLAGRRKGLGFSLADLAAKAGVSLSTARRVEQGAYKGIGLGHVLSVFAALGFSPTVEDISSLKASEMSARMQMLSAVNDPTMAESVRDAAKRRYLQVMDSYLLAALQHKLRGYVGVEPPKADPSPFLSALTELYGDSAAQSAEQHSSRHIAVARYYAELFGKDFNEEEALNELEARGVMPPTMDDPEL